jgi:hypothetical protein
MYLFGPVAVGEVIRGQVTCGTTPHPTAAGDTLAPSCGTPVVAPMGPEDPTPKSPRQELVGTADPGGIQSVTNVQVTNGTVQVGMNPDSSFNYLKFVPGQTGPLTLLATRDEGAEAANLPLAWAFDVTDVAGNTSHCEGLASPSPPGPPTLTITDISIAEGNSGTTPATFTVNRYGDTSGTTNVTWKTGGGTATAGNDFTANLTGSLLTFGPTETTKSLTVNVSGDTQPEKDETFTIALSGATTGTIMGDAAGKATIRNDDGASFLAVRSIVVAEGNSGTTPATFTITRTGNTVSTSTVTAKVAGGNATSGVDYASVADTPLTFTSGQTSKTVTVNVNGDTAPEPNETFNLVLSLQSVGTTLADASATAYIDDDDGTTVAPSSTFFEINNVLANEGDANGPASFTVSRYGSDLSATSTVSYKTGGGTATGDTDYTSVSAGTVTFTPGQTTKTVTISILGDTVPEKDETLNVTLFAPPKGNTLGDAVGTATLVNDDDASYLAVTNMRAPEGNSGTSTFEVTVTRYGNTTSPATAKAKTGGGTALAGNDYTAISGVDVNFAAGESEKTVSVTVNGDTAVEKDETFNVTLTNPGLGVVLADAAGTATIVNEDV